MKRKSMIMLLLALMLTVTAPVKADDPMAELSDKVDEIITCGQELSNTQDPTATIVVADTIYNLTTNIMNILSVILVQNTNYTYVFSLEPLTEAELTTQLNNLTQSTASLSISLFKAERAKEELVKAKLEVTNMYTEANTGFGAEISGAPTAASLAAKIAALDLRINAQQMQINSILFTLMFQITLRDMTQAELNRRHNLPPPMPPMPGM